MRFEEKKTSALEPEGLNTNRVYINGLSTSLPKDVQEKWFILLLVLKKQKLSNMAMLLNMTISIQEIRTLLQHKKTQGLFLVGQINGTSDMKKLPHRDLLLVYLQLENPLY